MNLTPGMRFGPYEIGPALGSGGMGEVWKAHDPRLGRDVAIKCLRQDLATQRIQVHRFEREARAASSLNHPNIITIYEIGEWNGQPFIAMEFVEGQRLRDVLAEGTLPLDRGLRIASEMAEALAAAHARGIVHRDLKPENVMLTRDGRVKVLDFGLAKPEDPTHDAGATDAVTLPGLVVGTAGYMAPEQARGAGADFRSDQFSLGAVLYEIFGGRSPFRRGSTMETISAILHDEPPPLVELDPLIPPQLAGIVQRCLSKAPADRYGSTADLAHDLRQLRASLTPTSRGSAFHAAPVRPASRRRAAVWATVLVAVLAVTGVWVFRNVPRQKATDALQQGAAAIPASETLPREKVVAILPFKEVTGEKEWRLIGEG
ncbi:MAG: serine/threonine-protein kinase, partial [Thermoanaerobaculia bacterium]